MADYPSSIFKDLDVRGALKLPGTGYPLANGGGATTYSATVPIGDLASIAANSVLCNATDSSATPAASTTLPSGLTMPGPTISGSALISGSYSGPTWASYTTQYQPVVFNINSLPVTSMFGGFTPGGYTSGGQASALIGAIDTPSTDTALLQPGNVPGQINVGIQGVARSASMVKGSVGVFGGGMANADNTQQWGLHGIATNWGSLTGTSAGYQGTLTVAGELNVRMNNPSAGALTGKGVGLLMYGSFQSIPTGGAYGIEIGGVDATGTLGWSAAIAIDDVPNIIGISIGATGAGPTAASQSIAFKSRVGGVDYFSSIYADQYADLVLNGKANVISPVPLILNGSTSGGIKLQVPDIAGSNTLTLPAATDTLIGRGTTDTLTNKTFIAPILGSATATSIAIAPASGLNAAFNTTQNVSGTLAASYNANRVNISSDVATITGANFLNGFVVEHHIGGAGLKGGRQSLLSALFIDGQPDAGSGNSNFVSATNHIEGGQNLRGTGVTWATANGGMFAINPSAIAKDGATNLLELTGAEVNVAMQTGASAYAKFGFSVTMLASDAVQGSVFDAGYELRAQTGAVGLNDGILFDDLAGNAQFPVKSTGTLIRASLNGPTTVANGIDFGGLTITGYGLKLPNFTVTGAGAVNAVALTANSVSVGANQVLGARITGWGAASNTLSRAAFDTSTVTTADIAKIVGALVTDLRTHGLIGN